MQAWIQPICDACNQLYDKFSNWSQNLHYFLRDVGITMALWKKAIPDTGSEVASASRFLQRIIGVATYVGCLLPRPHPS